MKSPIQTSLDNLDKTARTLAKTLKGGEILALMGPLGSGKTTFTQKLVKRLKVKHAVTSPTFVLMNLFKAFLPKQKLITIYHLDLYRTKSFSEIRALGITEVWGNKNTLTIIEWAEKIKNYLPKNAIIIKFKN
jgi:tRNA threonylcarbamoyladenosine biosynthesis protein TsaE